MDMAVTRELDQTQTETFNVEYVSPKMWARMYPHFSRQLGDHGRILDVGGGNGRFIDLVLQDCPKATGVNLEPAANLIRANNPHHRKTIQPHTLQDLDRDQAGSFDLISINWVLHHLVTGSYRDSMSCQLQAMRKLRQLLRPGGSVVVLENIYEGPIFRELPSRLIYELTASTSLQSIVKKAGANTAGIGVCFHSEQTWRALFLAAGFVITRFEHCYQYGDMSLFRRTLLHSRQARVGLFVLEVA